MGPLPPVAVLERRLARVARATEPLQVIEAVAAATAVGSDEPPLLIEQPSPRLGPFTQTVEQDFPRPSPVAGRHHLVTDLVTPVVTA